MATVINKRQHQLREGAVTLMPGENTVDDEQWSKANVKGSQLEQWQRLNWVAVKRNLPVTKDAPERARDAASAAGASPMTAGTPGGLPVATQPQGYNPPPGAAAMNEAEQSEEAKRSRRPPR